MAMSAGVTAQYGSIAFSPNTGAGYGWGFSWGYGSRQDAKYRSVRECRDKGGEDCREIGWFRNNCGALAISPEGGYGTGYGNTRVTAESKAISACHSAGNTSCRVPISRCSTVTVAQSSGFVAKQAQPVKLDRDQMRKVQKALAAQGTNPGPADGVYGAKTRAAIQAWQIKKGYQATGVLTRIQIQMLMESAQQTTVARTGKDLYGSIAFSQEYDGSYAWSIVWNSDGWEPAREKAIDVCRKEGGSDCNELGRFRNTCASLAIGDRGGAGTGGGKVIAEAEQNALARCRNAGTSNCKVEVSRCTDSVFEIAGTKKPAVAERKTKTETVAEPEPAVTESKAKVADLSPKCSEARRENCWQELDEQPGCHIYRAGGSRSHYDRFEPNIPIRGSGECRGGLFNGTLTLKDRTRYNVSTGPYVDGKRNGDWEEYLKFDDGEIYNIQKGPYVDGKRNGDWVIDQSPKVISEGLYVDNKRHGCWEFHWWKSLGGDTFGLVYEKGREIEEISGGC